MTLLRGNRPLALGEFPVSSTDLVAGPTGFAEPISSSCMTWFVVTTPFHLAPRAIPIAEGAVPSHLHLSCAPLAQRRRPADLHRPAPARAHTLDDLFVAVAFAALISSARRPRWKGTGIVLLDTIPDAYFRHVPSFSTVWRALTLGGVPIMPVGHPLHAFSASSRLSEDSGSSAACRACPPGTVEQVSSTLILPGPYIHRSAAAFRRFPVRRTLDSRHLRGHSAVRAPARRVPTGLSAGVVFRRRATGAVFARLLELVFT